MANLRLKLSEVTTRVADYLGWTDGTEPTGTTLTDTENIVARGYRRYLYPVNRETGEAHEWSFLKDLYVVTLTSGKWKYQLPPTFSEALTKPVYDDDAGYRQMMQRTPEEILDMRAADTISSAPYFYAIVPAHFSEEVGDLSEMWFWPEPDSTQRIKFFMKLDPLKPSDSDDYIIGGVRGSEAMLENCLAVAEQQEDNKLGIHTELAERLTQELIKTDLKSSKNIVVGNLYDNRDIKFAPHSNSTIDLDNIYPSE